MNDPIFGGTSHQDEFSPGEMKEIGSHVLDIMVMATTSYSFEIGSWHISVRLARVQDWRTVLLLMWMASDLSAAQDVRGNPRVVVNREISGTYETLYVGSLDDLARSMGHM